jgi:hypothetical protein
MHLADIKFNKNTWRDQKLRSRLRNARTSFGDTVWQCWADTKSQQGALTPSYL